MDDFESFQTSVEEVTADVETATELELEVGPEEVRELLKCIDKSLTGEDFLLMDKQTKCFKMESTLDENDVNIVEMTIKNVEYYKNSVDKLAEVLERFDTNFERRSTVGKMLSNSMASYRETFRE
jgi:hypothetical protein